MIIIGTIFPRPNVNYSINIEADKHTDDSQVKLKARSMDLIKYNPNLFRNRSRAQFYEMMGGNRTGITIVGTGLLFSLFRMRANVVRHLSIREGIWFANMYFWFGAFIGTLYSAAYFVRWQQLMNDYCANYLLKRYKGCETLDRANIYRFKDIPNTNEFYVFSAKYANSYHV